MPPHALHAGAALRRDGTDFARVRLLAESAEPLPPIVVRRATMRVVDGVHRLLAARRRGDETIAVRFFEGDERESFVLAVRLNLEHGRSLSTADRIAAATRIIAWYPSWSDRAIGAVVGVSGKTIGKVRRRSAAAPRSEVRIGQDGRARPVSAVRGRLAAGRLLMENPEISLRAVAKAVGISPSTVLDVRNRLRRGEDPVPAPRERPAAQGETETGRRKAGAGPGAAGAGPGGAGAGLGAAGAGQRLFRQPRTAGIRQNLRQDPALRFTESGRNLLRWLDAQAVDPTSIAGSVPAHCAPVVAELARQTAEAWLRLARQLDHPATARE
ncbi:winged helix-turn-helix transcriptional regulator [Crossiella sp. SN42]|uniref:winged helix-turn-helix transcriptional regulator n=1 Tax=Crossiella sp. SN42 TaxID=2944808 RepID=UPI00207D2103|nr:winged helix-turn-helix transcriptional regulator [Crossiella sp. SN42]MCO1575759.1 winged helix-turn-helix transcriptional regulator [Crossiella sp. SN42]